MNSKSNHSIGSLLMVILIACVAGLLMAAYNQSVNLYDTKNRAQSDLRSQQQQLAIVATKAIASAQSSGVKQQIQQQYQVQQAQIAAQISQIDSISRLAVILAIIAVLAAFAITTVIVARSRNKQKRNSLSLESGVLHPGAEDEKSSKNRESSQEKVKQLLDSSARIADFAQQQRQMAAAVYQDMASNDSPKE